MLDYYLPDGLRYATLTGPVPDTGVTDWRDGVERLEATSRRARPAAAARLAPARPAAALVVPQIYAIGRWSAPWTRLVRLRSEEWLHISNDAALRAHRRRARRARSAPPEPGARPGLVKR